MAVGVMMEPRLLVTAGMLVCMCVHMVLSHREHKVHNIVLYPDKHSWCKTTAIKQVVAYPGCSAVHVDNNVCVGACFSYSIPRTTPNAPGELIKPYCDSCQPYNVTWQHVTLECEGKEDMQERVQMITRCSCSPCDMGEEGGGSSSGQSVPDLIEAQFTRRHNNETIADPPLNDSLVLVLKQLAEDEEDEEESQDVDAVALKELFRKVEGVDHRVNQVALTELVRRVEESENILVDIDKLRQVLTRFSPEGMEKEHPHARAPHRHHLHHQHHSSHHAVVPEVGHVNLGDMPSTLEPSTSPQPIDDGGLIVNSEVGTEETRDPTLDVASHHLKPAHHGTELGYHENIVLPENQKGTNTESDDF